MGANSRFYFNDRISVSDVIIVIEQEFSCEVNAGNIKKDVIMGYGGFISFPFNGKTTKISIDDNSTISMPYSKDNIAILERIAAYFGGFLEENDCDNSIKQRFIPAIRQPNANIEIDNLRNEIYKQLGFDKGVIFMDFLLENKELIINALSK